MILNIYKAECGDAAGIRYLGNDNCFHNIFFDAGLEGTFYNILFPVIEGIIQRNEKIDCWILSHIHGDHIGGIVGYVEAIQRNELRDVVEKWIYNSPRSTSDLVLDKITTPAISVATSIRQGDFIASYLQNRGMLSPSDYIFPMPILNFSGLDIEILSPDSISLQKLRSKYHNPQLPLDFDETTDISLPTSSTYSEYNIKLENLLSINSKNDTSVENRSSIATVFTFKAHKLLWLSDSHEIVVASALRSKGFSSEKPFVCDVMQVAHHGSKGNSSAGFYEMISCAKYVISADGENNYGLPHKQCIANILCNEQRDLSVHYTIYFTYKTDIIENMFLVDGEDVFTRLNFSIRYPEDSKNSIEISL